MKRKIDLVLNIVIVVLAVVGTCIMFRNKPSATGLIANGFENFKYFTVLSNEFCGLVAAIGLVFSVRDMANKDFKPRKWLIALKYMAVTGVGLTFLVIAAFLGPLYGHSLLYRGSNLYFHLLLPVAAMAEFAILDTGEEGISFKTSFLTVIPTIVYGLCYLINLLVNGVGEWPDTNDFYGFVNWGLPVGLGIFAGIVVASWGLSLIMRLLNKKLRPDVSS